MRKNKERKFLLCIENRDCDDLIKGKIYRVLEDKRASQEAYIRVIDDSGEDYLYPEAYFVPVELPRESEKALNMAI